jgi:hypothetical protein
LARIMPWVIRGSLYIIPYSPATDHVDADLLKPIYPTCVHIDLIRGEIN